jgi:glyoxylase-like metal-dependent hydrolase (beta-lactamase superfamily II)
MPPLPLGKRVTLFGFRLPTSENVYVFQHDGELTMIDAGYGIYYDDIKKLFRKKKWDLSRMKRIFITHADADHAGTSGYFADEFGKSYASGRQRRYRRQTGPLDIRESSRG